MHPILRPYVNGNHRYYAKICVEELLYCLIAEMPNCSVSLYKQPEL